MSIVEAPEPLAAVSAAPEPPARARSERTLVSADPVGCEVVARLQGPLRAQQAADVIGAEGRD